MNFNGMRIYYMEDKWSDFECLATRLRTAGATVLPEDQKTWGDQMVALNEYIGGALEDKDEKLPAIQRMLLEQKIDLLIMDIYLNGDDAHYLSTDIFNEVLKNDRRLMDIPVLFLSRITDQEPMPIGHEADFVHKPSSLTPVNVEGVYKDLLTKASGYDRLLKIAYKPQPVQQKVIPDAVINAPPLKENKMTLTEWLTANF